ncbi:MAG TPA: MlaD family protein [Nocardioides sp.]|nr:MlaD family protein [Nocardioides sp.]
MNATSPARVAALTLVLVLAVVGVLAIVRHGTPTMTITADFTRTTGLYQDNQVTVLGVPVGKVASIKPDGTVVHVTLEVDADTPIPATAKAVIMQRSLVTDRYVELTPAYDDGSRLADGDNIPITRTVSPIGADDVLASVNRLLGALDAAGHDNLRDLIHATARNFDGNGAAVARVIVGVRKLAATGAASTTDLNSIVTGLDQLTVALTRRDALVNRFSSDLTTVTVQFAHDRRTFASTIKDLGSSLRFLTRFLVTNQRALGSDVQRVAVLAGAMRAHEAQLASVLKVTPQAFLNVADAVSPQGQLYVNANGSEFLKNPALVGALCTGALKVLCPTSVAPARSSRTGAIPLSLRSLLGGTP